MRAQAEDCHPDMQAALQNLLSSGGKRIRPTLGLLIGNLLGADRDKLITLGAAIEMLHTATLVHDDLIDGALLRRGTPTLNSRWAPAATVLTGDFLFAKAAKLAAESDCLPLMRMFAETLATIVNGELTQMFSSRGLIKRDDYYQRIYAKTASLFEMSARAAAMISPVDDKTVSAMREFGYEIGMAFQIVDDILDFTGEQTTVGKPVGSDLLQGIVTLPTLYYIECHPDDPDVRNLAKEGGSIDEEKMKNLIISIQGSDSIQKSINEANQFIERGLHVLLPFKAGVERAALEELARYIVHRRT